MATDRNATHLFKEHMKSEQWWTSLFSMFLVNGAHTKLELPLWHYRETEMRWCFVPHHEPLTLSGLKLSQVHVEAAMPRIFRELLTPELRYLANPDVIINFSGEKRCALIENKTFGAGIGNLSLYVDAAEELKNHGFRADALILISAGHPDNLLWRNIIQLDLPIILWEDVLRKASRIEWIQRLFGSDDLAAYTAAPLEGDK